MDFLTEHWGDIASVIGLVLTIWTLKKAIAAVKAVELVKARISGLDMLAEISAARTILEEIRRLQRISAWDLALDRYGVVRKHLVKVEAMGTTLTDAQQTDLGEAINGFRIIEEKIESTRQGPTPDQLNIARFNKIVAKHEDALDRILIAIKKAGA